MGITATDTITAMVTDTVTDMVTDMATRLIMVMVINTRVTRNIPIAMEQPIVMGISIKVMMTITVEHQNNVRNTRKPLKRQRRAKRRERNTTRPKEEPTGHKKRPNGKQPTHKSVIIT